MSVIVNVSWPRSSKERRSQPERPKKRRSRLEAFDLQSLTVQRSQADYLTERIVSVEFRLRSPGASLARSLERASERASVPVTHFRIVTSRSICRYLTPRDRRLFSALVKLWQPLQKQQHRTVHSIAAGWLARRPAGRPSR